MPILNNWQLVVTIDRVLRAEGINPDAFRKKAPRLEETANQALALGLPILEPVVVYKEYKIKSVQHERLLLTDGVIQTSLSGKGIVRSLAPAKQVIAMLCTIGSNLEKLASTIIPSNPSLGLAIDATGSAAVEALIETACAYFREQAANRDWIATIPYSPGMDGWPVVPGQEQVFSLLGGAEELRQKLSIDLAPSGMMTPQKSLTAVLGLGPEVDGSGRVCDYCSVQQTCRHKDNYT